MEKALRERPDLAVSVRWRPFQLRPEIPQDGLPWHEFAVEKFGGEENMRAAFDRVAAAGETDGARFDFGRIASAPYFAGGADLNDHEQLAGIASKAGLDAVTVRDHLAGDAGVAEVRASQEEAARLGILGVPFYVFDGRYALSGAQPTEVFGRALEAVLGDRVL